MNHSSVIAVPLSSSNACVIAIFGFGYLVVTASNMPLTVTVSPPARPRRSGNANGLPTGAAHSAADRPRSAVPIFPATRRQSARCPSKIEANPVRSAAAPLVRKRLAVRQAHRSPAMRWARRIVCRNIFLLYQTPYLPVNAPHKKATATIFAPSTRTVYPRFAPAMQIIA